MMARGQMRKFALYLAVTILSVTLGLAVSNFLWDFFTGRL